MCPRFLGLGSDSSLQWGMQRATRIVLSQWVNDDVGCAMPAIILLHWRF